MDKSRSKSSRKVYRKIYKKVDSSDIQVGDRFTHVLASGDVWYSITEKSDCIDTIKVVSNNSLERSPYIYPIKYFIDGLQSGMLIRLPRKSIYCI